MQASPSKPAHLEILIDTACMQPPSKKLRPCDFAPEKHPKIATHISGQLWNRTPLNRSPQWQSSQAAIERHTRHARGSEQTQAFAGHMRHLERISKVP